MCSAFVARTCCFSKIVINFTSVFLSSSSRSWNPCCTKARGNFGPSRHYDVVCSERSASYYHEEPNPVPGQENMMVLTHHRKPGAESISNFLDLVLSWSSVSLNRGSSWGQIDEETRFILSFPNFNASSKFWGILWAKIVVRKQSGVVYGEHHYFFLFRAAAHGFAHQ